MGTWMGLDLVTGGVGFIGSHLVDRLIADGRSVRVLDSFVVGRRSNLRPHDGNPRLEIIEGDVADKALVSRSCAGAERVFHLAGTTSLALPRAETFALNVEGTRSRLSSGCGNETGRIACPGAVGIATETQLQPPSSVRITASPFVA